MAKLHSDLSEFIALLNSHRVEFVVVGGHAVAYHGYPRYTGDIDFLVRSTPANAERVLAALTAFGFGNLGITADDLLTPSKIIQLGRPPNRIDILTSISGVDFDSAWRSRIPARLDDHAVDFIGLTGRQKDLADIEKLRSVARKCGPGR